MKEVIKMLPKYRVPVDKKKHNNKKKTHEEYVEELKIKNPNVVPLERYVSRNVKIKHLCLIHNITWEINPANALQGKGCCKCAKEKYSKSRTKSHSNYVNELKIVNPDVEVIGKYIGVEIPVLHLFKKCGHILKVSPSNILHGRKCGICSNNKLKSHDEYVNQLYAINSTLDVLEEYVNAKTPILHRCTICGTIDKKKPNNVLSGKGCYVCSIVRRSNMQRKTQEEYLLELNLYNLEVEPLETYINYNTPILHLHKTCGHKTKISPANVLRGFGCGLCVKSKGEEVVQEYLTKNNIIYIPQHKYDDLIGVNGGLLSYDFYLPTYNLLIEFQGEQHEHPIEHFGGIKKFIKQKIHDTRKRKYCHDNNIKFIEIWYYEINKAEQILERYLNNLKLESVETTGVA